MIIDDSKTTKVVKPDKYISPLLTPDEGYVICEKCLGRGEYTIEFQYKEKTYHYYSKCGHCYATGQIDWVEKARGRLPGIRGFYIDNHPAGSLALVDKEIGKKLNMKSKIFDGHEYVVLDTERGEALYNELYLKEEE